MGGGGGGGGVTQFCGVSGVKLCFFWNWRRGGFTFHVGAFLPSELLSQYMCLPKTDDNDTAHKKMMQIPFLDI